MSFVQSTILSLAEKKEEKDGKYGKKETKTKVFFYQQNLFLKRNVGALKGINVRRYMDFQHSSPPSSRRDNESVCLGLALGRLLYPNFVAPAATFPGGKIALGLVVQTQYGLVQGLVISMPNPLSPIEVFLGISYAMPPIK